MRLHDHRQPITGTRGPVRLEATARDQRIARSPEETGRTVSEISAALP
jgi:hypothetical protein